MRHVRNPQMTLGEVGIADIPLDLRSRDDIPALLLGLPYLYSDETLRPRLFALLDAHILPGIDKTVGRPGMEMWRILVMGVVKQGLAAISTGCTNWRTSTRRCVGSLAIRTPGTSIATSTRRWWTM